MREHDNDRVILLKGSFRHHVWSTLYSDFIIKKTTLPEIQWAASFY